MRMGLLNAQDWICRTTLSWTDKTEACETSSPLWIALKIKLTGGKREILLL